MEIPRKLSLMLFDIFVLYRDRPQLLEQQLLAVDQINVPPDIQLNVIISDNSQSVGTISDTHNYEVRYRGNITVNNHLNICINETEADRFMLIHDDDIISSEILIQLNPFLQNHKYRDYAIVGNASTFRDSIDNIEGEFGSFRTVKIPTLEVFLLELFYFKRQRYPAFPCYVYGKNIKSLLHCDIQKGQRFADISFLMELYNVNRVVWIPYTTYYYRFHSDNDGHVADISSMISLFRHIATYNMSYRTKILVLFGYAKSIVSRFLKWVLTGV